MKVMIFHPTLDGFVVEWIKHLCSSIPPGMNLLLCLPDGYEEVVSNSPFNKKITYAHISGKDKTWLMNGSNINCSFKRAQYISNVVRQNDVNHVIILTFTSVLPFLPFLLPRRVAITGIVHHIYLYRWKEFSLWKKIFNVLMYKIIVSSCRVKKVFMLNDEVSSRYLNHLYHTSKFSFLPDPFNENNNPRNNVREQLGISETEQLFLHFGGLTYRKGTIRILKAIQSLTVEQSKNKCFVFAGKVSKVMRTEFYDIYNQIKNKYHIVVLDEFCEESMLHDLCYSSDFILIPYDNSSVSSGVIGFSAFYL